MKKYSIYLLLLLALFGIIQSSSSQETRVSGTIKVHPWIQLPAVISTDIQGGMQSLGKLTLSANPNTDLNTSVPAFSRQVGMIVSVNDLATTQIRYFEYTAVDAWREVFVINGWEPNHPYVAGDYVVYAQNYYVANSTFTSDGSTFATDAAKWNNAGGKDSKYLASELTMDGNALSKVAVATTKTVAVADSDKTITTAGYVARLVGAGVNINTNRPITLTGTNVSGLNLGGNGKTMADFFDAFFFPTISTPPVLSLSGVTPIPYSTWSTWPSASSSVSLTWGVTNLSQTDGTAPQKITSIKLKSGIDDLASATATLALPSGSGTFSPVTFSNPNFGLPTLAKQPYSKTFTLEVNTDLSRVFSKDLTLTMAAANHLTYSPLTIPTTTYEYSATNVDVPVSWNITKNDETVNSILVNGISSGTALTGSTTVVLKNTVTGGGTTSQTFPLVVNGSIYGNQPAANSVPVSWANRLYRGIITSAIIPGDPGFTFSSDQVKLLASETKLGGDWRDLGGYNFDFSAQHGYLCFAYPDDVIIPKLEAYGTGWMPTNATGYYVMQHQSFTNQNSYTSLYTYVFYKLDLHDQIYQFRLKAN